MMTNTAVASAQPHGSSGRSSAAFQIRGGRLTKLDGEVASCAPSLGRTATTLLLSTSIAGVLTGAFLALAAQEARAACTESAGVWTCTGVVTAAQSVKRSGSAISVNLDSGFDMDVARGVGFTVEQSGSGGIAFVQAAGGHEIVGHGGAVHATNSGSGDISITTTGKLAATGDGAALKVANSDASGGSVSVSVGSVIGSGEVGHAVEVSNSGSGTTAVAASGVIGFGSGQGDGVNVQTGRESSSVSVSVATVTGGRTGVHVGHSGSGTIAVSAKGAVEASDEYGGSHGLRVENLVYDSSISVAVAAVATKGGGRADGIHILQLQGGDVTVAASGSVSSSGRHGIFVDKRPKEGARGGRTRGDVKITVSGSVAGGGGHGDAAIKVNAVGIGAVRIVLENGAIVGSEGGAGIIVESDGNARVEAKRGSSVKGDVQLGAGDDALVARDGAVVSGEVDLGDGNDMIAVSGGAEVSGGVVLGRGNDSMTVSNARVSGRIGLGTGNDTLAVSGGARVSGSVRLWNGDDTVTVSNGAKVSAYIGLGRGRDTLTITNGSISGGVNFGGGSDSFNFGRGFSEVAGQIRGAENFTFESGAVAHIHDAGDADMGGSASLEIKSGAVVILDKVGHAHEVGSILLKKGGILNIADGVAGRKDRNSANYDNVSLIFGPAQEFNGTLIIDANFDGSWADGLAWDGTGSRNWQGTVLMEPAVIAGKQGGGAIVTSGLSKSQIRVPEGFSVYFDIPSQQFAIRQDLADGACANAGSGAFTCSGLIYKTQSVSASGEALKVVLESSSVVHALAGTQQGLSLRQSGAGGISLTQSASASRIAAAGDAIHAVNSGAGGVSVTVTGPVVGGLTRRVSGASGIVVDGGRGDVRISAASVTGVWHGIYASGDAGVSVRATGAVETGGGVQGGHAILVSARGIDSDVTVAVATVAAQGTGAADGIHVRQPHRGSVSVTASGSVSSVDRHGVFVDLRSWGRRLHGDANIGVSGSVTGATAAIRVESDSGDTVNISLESGAVVGRAGADAIIESDGNALVDVKAGAAVKGNVRLGRGNDTLKASSTTVSSNVNLGWGNDTLIVSSSTVSGGVDAGWGKTR